MVSLLTGWPGKLSHPPLTDASIGLIAETVLAAGGFIGGTLVFVYGVRVLKRADEPVATALIPGRSEPEQAPVPPPTERSS